MKAWQRKELEKARRHAVAVRHLLYRAQACLDWAADGAPLEPARQQALGVERQIEALLEQADAELAEKRRAARREAELRRAG